MAPKAKSAAVTKQSKKLVTSDDETAIESSDEGPKTSKQATKSKNLKTKPLKKGKRSLIDDDEEMEEKSLRKKLKKDEPVKHDAVMVIYKIDDSIPDLQATHNNKAGSVLLSDLFDINPDVQKSDVRIVFRLFAI